MVCLAVILLALTLLAAPLVVERLVLDIRETQDDLKGGVVTFYNPDYPNSIDAARRGQSASGAT
jgi:hypothetical protein